MLNLRASVVGAALLAGLWATCGADLPGNLDEDIQRNRKGVIVVKARPGQKVSVEQVRHEFWFGAAIANGVFSNRMPESDRAKYLSTFLTNFNAAVTENALKWHDMEQRQGEVNYQTVNAILSWTEQHNIPLRGHNIFWGIPNRVQDWLKKMSDDDLREALRKRAVDIGKRYKGRFAEYDLNNEMIHGNYYADRLGKDITLKMAQWVREGDPNAVLYLNDYDILTGAKLQPYYQHIRELLDMGVPIGGIGVQGHLHAETFDRKALKAALDRLAEFKLPIRVTEFNLPGQRSKYYQNRGSKLTEEEERAKAKDICDYYRICFAHPQVSGILMWGFWEGANWIGVSSMYRRDWTALPAADAYRDLVFREWWTRFEGQTDTNGKCDVSAFFGKHKVRVGTEERIIDLKKTEGRAEVSF